MSNIRYYSSDIIRIRMLGVELDYGYEYQGTRGLSVSTPLTDRVRQVLVLSLQMNMGAIVHGPHGIGKSTCIQSLSHALGRECVSTSISSLEEASRWVRGACSNGVWLCVQNSVD